jgi:hypothetical protein
MPPKGLRLAWTLAGALAAFVPGLWMWGFTVDDALIPVRYARHLASGAGWHFNVRGPATDGVTPLPWPVVLVPLANAEPLVVLVRAKAFGLVLWTATGSLLGTATGRVAQAPAWARAAALGALALSVPVAAHAVSGMETALATTLATCAALLVRRGWAAALLAGCAASLRPEMCAWALALAAASAFAARPSPLRASIAGVLAVGPFACCVLVRLIAWGRPAPLAVMAKPGGLEQGLAYAGAALVVSVIPLLVVAPRALARDPVALSLVAAGGVHAIAVAAVGGDWMPFARLMVPVVPSLAWAAVLLAARAHPIASAVRSAAAVVLGATMLSRNGGAGRNVMADREALVAAAVPFLRSARAVAALDVGWVGAATEADIVDLAGLTDPEIAALPGGHTSKRVDAMFLLERNPDVLLLYAPEGLPGHDLVAWRSAKFVRVVEARLVADDVIARHFEARAWLPLGRLGAGYVLLRATPPRAREDG